MTRFCKTHVKDRTDEELQYRLWDIEDTVNPGPGTLREKTNIEDEMQRRSIAQVSKPPSAHDSKMDNPNGNAMNKGETNPRQ